jgi:hypothetical protein
MLKGICSGENREDVFTIEATVPTGFEKYAAEEVLRKLGSYPVLGRGRIMFDIKLEKIQEVRYGAVDLFYGWTLYACEVFR